MDDQIKLRDAVMLIRKLCNRLPADDPVAVAAKDWIQQTNFPSGVLREDEIRGESGGKIG